MEQSGVLSEWVKTLSSAFFPPLLSPKKRKNTFFPGKAGLPQAQFGVLMPLSVRARDSNNHGALFPTPYSSEVML